MESDFIGLKKNALGIVFLVDGKVTYDKSAQGAEVDFFDSNVAVKNILRLDDNEMLELDGQKDILKIEIKEIGEDKDRQESIDCFARPMHDIHYSQGWDVLQSKRRVL